MTDFLGQISESDYILLGAHGPISKSNYLVTGAFSNLIVAKGNTSDYCDNSGEKVIKNTTYARININKNRSR
jgi:hypothetical protein